MNGRRPLTLIALAVWLAAGAPGIGAPRAAAVAQASAEKPVVYNHILEPGAALDRLVHHTYDATFQVVDFTDRDHIRYIPPHQTEGPPPTAPLDARGRVIEGKVVVLFIITAAGRVTNPVIISASDPRLSAAVLEALAHRVYEPPRLDGADVAATAGEEIAFPLPAP